MMSQRLPYAVVYYVQSSGTTYNNDVGGNISITDLNTGDFRISFPDLDTSTRVMVFCQVRHTANRRFVRVTNLSSTGGQSGYSGYVDVACETSGGNDSDFEGYIAIYAAENIFE